MVSSGAKAHDYFSSCAGGQKWDLDPAREGVPPLLYLLCVSMFILSLDENLEAGGKILLMRDRENGHCWQLSCML